MRAVRDSEEDEDGRGGGGDVHCLKGDGLEEKSRIDMVVNFKTLGWYLSVGRLDT